VTEDAISRYPIPDVLDLPDDLKDTVLTVQERTGFVPNVFLAFAHRPDEMRAFLAYHNALMEKEGGLSKAEREMIVVATSSENNCQYCVVAHGAILRIRAKNPLIADQVAINHLEADVSDRESAILEFAVKVAHESWAIQETDFQMLRGQGLDDEDIWDIAAIVSFFALSNRMANFLALRPNDDFYSMGR
jgi:uncharacterized peroxidase-related enzyme